MTRPPNPELPERILDTAEQIVAAGGHGSLSMRRLAEGVGITPTTLYYYFESRDHILLQLKLRAAWQINAKIHQIDPSWEPKRAIRALGEAYISFAEENPQLYKLYMEQVLDRTLMSEEDYKTMTYSYLASQTGLERMAARGLYKKDPRAGALTGWILLHGFASLLIAGTLERVVTGSREDVKNAFLDIYVNSVYKAGGSAAGDD
jgi:AcrR family transcriptional regulator